MHRVTIASYNEEGSTTTPFKMMLLNSTSRYHVAIQTIKGGAKRNEKVRLRLHELTSELTGRIGEVTKFILKEKTGKFSVDSSDRLSSRRFAHCRTLLIDMVWLDPDYLDEIKNFKIDTASLSEG